MDKKKYIPILMEFDMGIYANIFAEDEHVLGLHLDIRMGGANSLINAAGPKPHP